MVVLGWWWWLVVVIAASATHDMLCYEELALSCGWGGRHAFMCHKVSFALFTGQG